LARGGEAILDLKFEIKTAMGVLEIGNFDAKGPHPIGADTGKNSAGIERRKAAHGSAAPAGADLFL
jgi:hypothetical protein